MKFVLAFCACAAVVFAQTEHPAKPVVRNLPADVLRDFPGACFASTACRVFQVEETWPLSPFCGRATCLLGPNGELIEKVEDCGLRPKPSPGCNITNTADLEKEFPLCCPAYTCQAGSSLLFPTPEEIAAATQNAGNPAQKTQAAAP